MRTNNLAKMFCILLAFCGAMAVASPAQTFTSLYSFCTLSNCDDGKRPTAGLVQGADGNFYGTASGGGTGGVGTAFNISASGTLTPLHSFDISDGLNPYAPLVLANDGNFYGTTATGGSLTLGNVFKMTPSGMVSQVYSFCFQGQGCPEGSIPLAGLVQGTDGNLYGVTQDGGNDSCSGSGGPGCGVVFMLTTGGTLTVLHAFAGMDGASPYSGLTQGADGNFYGTTQFGGTGNNNSCIENSGIGCGTVFKITPSGTLTTLYEFCSQPNCTDGYGPQSGLVQAADGNFYGTTHWGGTATIGNGTIFRITPSGALTTLHKFVGYPNDGANPIGGLIQATDGNFYGTTPSAGAHFLGGTIFRMTPNGGLATLYSFCALSHCDDGSAPYGTLLQATDGNLYGTTSMGGVGCNGGFCGTVFKLSVGLGPFLRVQPGSGGVGTPVTIFGTNLTGATSVTFNGTPATIISNTGTEITTTVPAGATTGTVQVTTPAGTLNSNIEFQVTGPLQLFPVTPCRLVDTRKTGGSIQGGTSRNFTITQLGGCGIPRSAAAYSLNVTVVPHGSLGYLTIWPEGENQPLVSTMNSPDGRVKATAAIVPSGNSAVSVYVTNTADVVLDIDGYFTAPGSQTFQFYPLTPCRVVDTRNANGDLGGPYLTHGQQRSFPVLESTCGISNSAQAYSFNFTAIPRTRSLGFLSVWPEGQTPAIGFDAERYQRDDRGERGDCACRYERRHHGVCDGRY